MNNTKFYMLDKAPNALEIHNEINAVGNQGVKDFASDPVRCIVKELCRQNGYQLKSGEAVMFACAIFNYGKIMGIRHERAKRNRTK